MCSSWGHVSCHEWLLELMALVMANSRIDQMSPAAASSHIMRHGASYANVSFHLRRPALRSPSPERRPSSWLNTATEW